MRYSSPHAGAGRGEGCASLRRRARLSQAAAFSSVALASSAAARVRSSHRWAAPPLLTAVRGLGGGAAAAGLASPTPRSAPPFPSPPHTFERARKRSSPRRTRGAGEIGESKPRSRVHLEGVLPRSSASALAAGLLLQPAGSAAGSAAGSEASAEVTAAVAAAATAAVKTVAPPDIYTHTCLLQQVKETPKKRKSCGKSRPGVETPPWFQSCHLNICRSRGVRHRPLAARTGQTSPHPPTRPPHSNRTSDSLPRHRHRRTDAHV